MAVLSHYKQRFHPGWYRQALRGGRGINVNSPSVLVATINVIPKRVVLVLVLSTLSRSCHVVVCPVVISNPGIIELQRQELRARTRILLQSFVDCTITKSPGFLPQWRVEVSQLNCDQVSIKCAVVTKHPVLSYLKMLREGNWGILGNPGSSD